MLRVRSSIGSRPPKIRGGENELSPPRVPERRYGVVIVVPSPVAVIENVPFAFVVYV